MQLKPRGFICRVTLTIKNYGLRQQLSLAGMLTLNATLSKKRSQRIIPHVGSHHNIPTNIRPPTSKVSENEQRRGGEESRNDTPGLLEPANDCFGDDDITAVWEPNVCERVR